MRIRIGIMVAGMLAGLPAGGCQSRSDESRQAALGLSHGDLISTSDSSQLVNPTHGNSEVRTSVSKWSFDGAQGHIISTQHYRLYTTMDLDTVLERLPTFYELALIHYTTTLAELPLPTSQLETFLFQTRSQWQKKTQRMLPDQSELFMNLGRGGLTTNGTSVLYNIDRWGYQRDTLAIAAHEGWHQYTQRTFKQQLPIWLEEGVATYMEGFRVTSEGPEFDASYNRERSRTLRIANRQKELIPLDDLLSRTPQQFLSESKDSLLVYYSQVWALTRFLHEGADGRYREPLNRLLTDAAYGGLIDRMMASSAATFTPRRGSTRRVGRDVVLVYFNPDIDAFKSEFLAYINELTDPQMRRAEGRESPQQQVN